MGFHGEHSGLWMVVLLDACILYLRVFDRLIDCVCGEDVCFFGDFQGNCAVVVIALCC